MTGLRFTQHARERMEQRKISKQDIIRVLAFGEESPAYGRAMYWAQVRNTKTGCPHWRQHTSRVKNIVVVYRLEAACDPMTVITAYRQAPFATGR